MKDIGRELKAKREELGLSLAQAQADTKIRRRYLEALESGDDSPIPGEVYVKGFLRFYANYLGLDGWDMVRRYREWKEAAAADVAPGPAKGHGQAKGPGPARPAAPAVAASATATAPATPATATAPATPVSPGELPGRSARRPRVRAVEGAASAGGGLSPAAGAGPAAASAQRAMPAARLLENGRPDASGARRFWRILGYAVLVVALVVAGGIYYAWTTAPPPAGETVGGSSPGGSTGGSQAGTGSGGDTTPANPGGDANPGGSAGTGGAGTGGGSGSPLPAEPGWAVVKESEREADYVVYGSPFTVGFEIIGDNCWVQVYVDGKVVFEQTLAPGGKGEWSARQKVTIIFGRAECAQVKVEGQLLGAAGTTSNPRMLVFEAGKAPIGGAGSSGAGGGSGG